MGWKRSAGTCSLHPADAVWKGFGKFPTSIFARGRKDTEQKTRLGTRSHCLHTPRCGEKLKIYNAYASISRSCRCTIWVKQSSRSCGAGMLGCCSKQKFRKFFKSLRMVSVIKPLAVAMKSTPSRGEQCRMHHSVFCSWSSSRSNSKLRLLSNTGAIF